ncbi:MAG: endopeptidase La [Spirochaetaceae bacterium]
MKLLDKVMNREEGSTFPVLPLKESILYPTTTIPVFVNRKPAVQAVQEAMNRDRQIFVVSQTRPVVQPSTAELYKSGTVAHILQMMKLPDGSLRILIEGKKRASVLRYESGEPIYAKVNPIESVNIPTGESLRTYIRTIQDAFEQYAGVNKKISRDARSAVSRADDPERLIYLVATNVALPLEKKNDLLERPGVKPRLEDLAVALNTEIEVFELKRQISVRVQKRMEKGQRDYYLKEQVKELNKELGQEEEEDLTGAKEIESALKEKKLPEAVRERVEKELGRLRKLQPISPEAGIIRTYLDWLIELPWFEKSEEQLDIGVATRILDEDHYDMQKPKDRILDYIAVRKLNGHLKGPILCFVGPPGTGKTSLGQSLARALGREFVRISLGGVRDEAEIRGHRRTYVGALPGKIIQSIRKAKSRNPLFLLDEIDKMSSDFRGDPASAMLEVLDPEQNKTFVDHYLELSYDLSEVLFVTTANSLHTIPWPLRDRMEVIEIPGYSEIEKLHIANQFIVPKQLREHGLEKAHITFQKNALLDIIRNYTMESGVRNLEREISGVIRKLARKASAAEKIDVEGFKKQVTPKLVKQSLGNPKYERSLLYAEPRVGLANGLAWTEMGGMLLPIETVLYKGKGELILTGNLGEVMKESARTALSYLRSCREYFSSEIPSLASRDIHIHVPEGAIPKDGPSAGITLVISILSALVGEVPRGDFAMTGEITLTGRVLPVGGIKEKCLAAHRHNVGNILLPGVNRKDADELPREVAKQLQLHYADTVLEALQLLFPEAMFFPSRKRRRSIVPGQIHLFTEGAKSETSG